MSASPTAANLKMFVVEDGEKHWLASTSADECLKSARERYEIGLYDDEGVLIKELEGDQLLPITLERVDADAPDIPPEAELLPSKRGDSFVIATATVSQWLSVCEAGDLVASTVW